MALGGIVLALLALGLAILFNLVPEHGGNRFPSIPKEKQISRANVVNPSQNALGSFESRPSTFDVAGFTHHPRRSFPGKSLLDSEPFLLWEQPLHAPPALDSVVELKLPGSWHSDAPVSFKRNLQTKSRLARLTVYWPEEGDYHTRNRRSSSGVRLRDGHCAVDPKVIPYGSVISVPGVGELVAVDTGPAVVSRRAARAAGRTPAQRNAIVIDIFCSSPAKARAIIERVNHFAVVTWQLPDYLTQSRTSGGARAAVH